MAVQTFTSSSSDWLPINRGLHITLRNVCPIYFQVIGRAVSKDNDYTGGTAECVETDESDSRWNNLFADPRSEDIFLAFANEAREASDIELLFLED